MRTRVARSAWITGALGIALGFYAGIAQAVGLPFSDPFDVPPEQVGQAASNWTGLLPEWVIGPDEGPPNNHWYQIRGLTEATTVCRAADSTWKDYIFSFDMKLLGPWSLGTQELAFLLRSDDAGGVCYAVNIEGSQLNILSSGNPVLSVPITPAFLVPNVPIQVTLGVSGGGAGSPRMNIQVGPLTIPTVTLPAGPLSGSVGFKCRGIPVEFDNVKVTGANVSGAWTGCLVEPNPVGKVPAGGLKITLKVTGGAPSGRVYVVPQGVDRLDRAHQIPMRLSSSGSEEYIYTNDKSIDTAMDTGGTPISTPVQDGYHMDGHAYVDLDDPNLDPSTLADPVSRHFLIDTVPPKVSIVAATSIDNIVENANTGPFAALGVPFETAGFPYPKPETLGPLPWPQVDAAIADRRSHSVNVVGPEPIALYNIGSFSNGYNDPGQLLDRGHLRVKIFAAIEDQTVYDAFGITPGANDTDKASELNAGVIRQTSGFDNPTTYAFDDAVAVLSGSTGDRVPCYWVMAGDTVSALGAAQALIDVNILNVTPGFVSSNDKAMASWIFNDKVLLPSPSPGTATGIPVLGLSAEPLFTSLHLSGTFVAVDRVGNSSLSNTGVTAPSPPLHIWWIPGTETATPVQLSMESSDFPRLSWDMTRSYNLGLEVLPENPVPLYTYRVWRCSLEGQDNGTAPYEPITDWAEWSPNVKSIPPTALGGEVSFQYLDQYHPLRNRWVLVAVGGMDEAGNVEPWPTSELGLDLVSGELTVPDQESGKNWMRFFVPGSSATVDTSLAARFAYDNPLADLGAATVIQYPQSSLRRILGTFDVGMVLPASAARDAAHCPYVILELEREGAVIMRVGLQNCSGDRATLQLPQDIEKPPADLVSVSGQLMPSAPFVLGDPNNVVNYALRATTVCWVQGLNPSDYVEVTDPSPASVYFKVVPKSIETYLQPPGTEEPFKVYERE